MSITINEKKTVFFNSMLRIALARVVPVGTPADLFRSFEGLEGYVVTGFGHEAEAMLLLDCLLGLPDDIGGDVLENLTLRALVDCKSKNRPDKNGFLESLTAFIDGYASQETKLYRCMFFLQCSNLPAWITARPILGHKIKPAPRAAWTAIAHRLAEMCQKANLPLVVLDQMQAVEIQVRARRELDAIQEADLVCKILRGAYFVSQGSRWQFAGTPERANDFKPSPLYLVRLGKVHVKWAFVPHVELKQIELPDPSKPATALLLKTVQSALRKGSPRDRLAQSLAHYAGSGDAPIAHNEFLGMWQALEVLALVDSGETFKIATRIGNLFVDGNESVRPQIVALASFRNRLVHVGEFDPERQSANFLLANIVRHALIQFAHLCAELRTREQFIQLMSLMTRSAESLPRRGKVAKMVRQIRSIP